MRLDARYPLHGAYRKSSKDVFCFIFQHRLHFLVVQFPPLLAH